MKKHRSEFEIWDLEIDPRIEQLRTNNFHLEAFYLYSNTLEFILKSSIMSQQDWISGLVVKSGLTYKKTKIKTLDDKTLGQLIHLFSEHCSDKILINELENFNSFRVQVSHKLFQNDISKLNNSAKKYYTMYNLLVSKICRYNIFLNTKRIRKIRARIKNLKS